LRQAGIEVIEGVLAAEAVMLNEVFIKWVTTKLPFAVLKTAMSLDGKIATYTGNSQWITGPAARQRVHLYRHYYDAVLVGIGTVLADNPELTVRLPQAMPNPKRIIVDSRARTPLTAKVVNDGLATTIIAVAPDAPPDRVAALAAKGVEIMTVPRGQGGIDLRQLFVKLGQREVTSVMIEGGMAINGTVLAANLLDKVYWFVAPKIIGGAAAPGPIGGTGASIVDNAVLLENLSVENVDGDLLISGYIPGREGRDVYWNCGRNGNSAEYTAGK
jgi:diaminohydroxyphosphoribosylaminopyrimidine deaminase/5-amino-6-(5-phosphoribosylamino)uracil reductase